MKHILVIPVLIVLSYFNVDGQLLVFEDDFENYETGTALIEEGYNYWGNVFIVDETDTNKYARSESISNNSAFDTSPPTPLLK
jgi:hypothetical protein